MKRQIEIGIIASALLLSGCATKKYVAQQVDPANAKIGEVDKNQKNTQRQLEADEPKISAADEKATSADSRATDAIGRADGPIYTMNSMTASQILTTIRLLATSRCCSSLTPLN